MSLTESLPTELHRVTGLGRHIDLSLRSNQIAVGGSAIAGLITLLISSSFFQAMAVGVGVFLAWALTREIDPDNVSGSYVAMALAGIIGLFVAPAPLVVGVLLLTARIFAGTVGSGLRTTDLFVLVAAAAYAGSQPVAWPIVALLAYAVTRSAHRWSLPAAVVIGAAGFSSAALFVRDLAIGLPGVGTWLLLMLAGLAGWRRIAAPRVDSAADDGSRLESRNIGLARLAVLGAISAGSVMAPETALLDLAPALSAFLVMAVRPRRTPRAKNTVDEPVLVEAPRLPVV